ncbi:hypothetical protein BGX26_006398, partial [Mortierella sp. AD094]
MTNLRSGLRSEKVQVAKVFNPNKPGAGYFLTLSEPGLLSAQDYVAFRVREIRLITSATPISVLKEWNSWMRSLSGCDCGSWSFAASRAPALTKKIVSAWISEGTHGYLFVTRTKFFITSVKQLTTFSQSPQLDQSTQPIQSASSQLQPLPQSPHVAQSTQPQSAQPIQSASSQPAQSDLLSSSMAESSESSITESSSSSITMTPAILDEMRKQFSKNYNDYSERDQELFKVALNRTDSIEELPLWKGREIMRYSKDLDGVAEVTWNPGQNTISSGLDQAELRGFNKRLHSIMLRLSILYEDCNNALSESQSESWYITK